MAGSAMRKRSRQNRTRRSGRKRGPTSSPICVASARASSSTSKAIWTTCLTLKSLIFSRKTTKTSARSAPTRIAPSACCGSKRWMRSLVTDESGRSLNATPDYAEYTELNERPTAALRRDQLEDHRRCHGSAEKVTDEGDAQGAALM